MDREQIRTVVRATLTALVRITKRTRTPADDLMLSILQANEDRLVNALARVLAPGQPVTEEQIVQALKSEGMDV